MLEKNILKTRHGELIYPVFLPDATYGSVKTLSFKDVERLKTQGVVTTTLHIEKVIGSNKIKNFGGINKFFGYNAPILTDSGGWQVFSLINAKNSGERFGHATKLGCTFFNEKSGKTILLTPESSLYIQKNLEPDIMTVLDYPIHGDASLNERKECVKINTDWAKRSSRYFNRLFDMNSDNRPLLGCVIQGGDDFALRKQSANELLEIGFDIYNFGGMPIKSETTWKKDEFKGFYYEMLEYVSSLIPNNKPKYAMGVGQPDDIAFCVECGWNIFDTVLPTRNARHGYLYVSEGSGDQTKSIKVKNAKGEYKTFAYDILRIRNKIYEIDDSRIDPQCDCEACENTSKGYLRHLINIKEASGLRLATIHNLNFYNLWMTSLRNFFY